jgi:hypothetical protein
MESGREDIVEFAYEVEKILHKKLTPQGERTYLIKWKHYDNLWNSWVLEKDVDPELIKEYEDNRKRSEIFHQEKTTELFNDRHKFMEIMEKMEKLKEKQTIPEKSDNPFKFGLEPSHVLKVEKKDGKFYYSIKWKHGKVSKVESDVVCQECPQLALDYYSNLPFEGLEEL